MYGICNLLFVLLSYRLVHTEYIYQSLSVISSQGYQYSPVVPSAQLISSTIKISLQQCLIACNINPLCRVFDFSALISQQCRLFQGDIQTLGTLVPASRSDSLVGTIEITPSLFDQYGQSCSPVCTQSRYLICINSTCRCATNTYWDTSARICRPQSPILGASCQQGLAMCREDLNYTCLQFNQCGPLSVLSGTTVFDRNTTIHGSSVVTLREPYGITMYGVDQNESLVVVDLNGRQVVHIKNVNLNNRSVSAIVRNNTAGTGFHSPFFAFVDVGRNNDLYVSDLNEHFVVLFSAMQSISPPPRIVAGINQTSGPGLHEIDGAMGIAVDPQQNLYVADIWNNRVMRWAPNATSGVVIAGRGVLGSDSMSLNRPAHIFLDANSSLLYVADVWNHRIQMFRLHGTPPYNGTTVAGGNGAGSGSHQLITPYSIWVSKKTGTIYIADEGNHRIQRWSRGASSGVTVAGSPSGIFGSHATRLNTPHGLVINSDETRMYVSDTGNRRVQRFNLI